MKLEFKKSFTKDLRKREQERSLFERVQEVILAVEQADNIQEINNLKKLKSKGNQYRIRLSDYRIGLVIESDTVCFVRFLHRKEIYKYFP